MDFRPLPIGIDDFKDIVKKGYYYVDKTLLIKELLDMKGAVNLFTRPRRFGKTLNISMLRYFFDHSFQDNADLFVGTKIMEAGERYLSHMGKYPVICLNLKSMKQRTYTEALYCLKEEISEEYKRHYEIVNRLEFESDRKKYMRIIDMGAEPEEYLTAIRFLSRCLRQVYKENVVILIDEYDVPLENAYFAGFYEEMTGLIRSLFESALKTNSNLEFAVITGCLRISKESIFTGLNNLKIMSLTSNDYAEHFGFTQKEVDQMLEYYGITGCRETMKKWYDGYMFGNEAVYNPWSVINYTEACWRKADALPLPYWSNTSSNSIVKKLVESANLGVKQEIELLIAGESIEKPVHEDITYEDMDSTQDNLWNFLFFTGYLKKISERMKEETRYIKMAIPNSEVRYIYKNTILQWFEEKIQKKDLTAFYNSILEGDTSVMEEIMSDSLMETISFYDYQEDFYHGFLAGMLKNIGNYIVLSNRESGNGRPDILLKYPSIRGKAVIMELKVAGSYQELEAACEKALVQIEDRKYEEGLRQEGYRNIIKYGVAFYKKECMVRLKRK